MNHEHQQKVELTQEQISLMLQIINKTNFTGESVEVITDLKQTLLQMLKQKQQSQNLQPTIKE